MEIINEEQEAQSNIPKRPKQQYQPYRHRGSSKGRATGGIILILLGIILMLANFDIIQGNISHYIFNWKTILIVLGIIFIGAKDNKTSGYILLVLGIIFWLPEFVGDYYISLGDVFWPSILIIIGILLITRHNGLLKHRKGDFTEPNGYLNDISIFSGGIKIIKSKNFKGGNLTAIFGGSEFDLRQVVLNPNGAILDVVTIFGGTKIIVPEDWNIYPDAVSILGNISDKRAVKISNNSSNKSLIIKGVIILGGVEIKSF